MKITVADYSGFCFGVERAIDVVEKEVAQGVVYTVGPVIHNPSVVENFRNRGVKVVDSVHEVPEGATVVIRSHGMAPQELEALRGRGARIVDATCPLVNRAQQRAAELDKEGYRVIIIGDRLHPEVVALKGCAPGAIVVESPSEVPEDLGGKRVGVVAQTTRSTPDFAAVVGALAAHGPMELRAYCTICSATVQRQTAVRKLAGKVDVMFVLGGRNSANTSRLAEIARQMGTRTHHLESAEELQAEMVRGAQHVGVAGGASTPNWIVKSFVEALERLHVQDEGGPGNR